MLRFNIGALKKKVYVSNQVDSILDQAVPLYLSPDDSTLGVPKALLRFQGSVTRPKIGLASKKVNVDAKEGVTFEI